MTKMANPKENLFVPTTLSFKEGKSDVKSSSKMTTTTQIDKYDPLVFCRTCANMDPCLVPIFKGEGLDHKLDKKIEKYLPIQVSEEDDLPLSLCYQCASTLIAWDTLVLGCLEAEKKLNLLKKSLVDKQSEDVSDKEIDGIDDLLSDTIDTDDEPLSFKKGNMKATKSDEKRDILQEKNDLQRPLDTSELDSERCMEEPVLSFFTYQHQLTLNRPLIAEILKLKTDNTFCCKICSTIGNLKFDYMKSCIDLQNKTNANVKAENNCDDSTHSEPFVDKLKKRKRVQSKCRVVCDNCGKTFSSKLSLKNHMKIHFVDCSLNCRECGKVFRYRFNLLRHMRVIHEGVRKHACADCGKRFRSRGEMEDHRNVHNIQQKIICEECGRVFLTKASFYPHKKYHRSKNIVKEKHKYSCEKCDKVLTTKKSRAQHMLIHTGEKPIVCTTCGKKFRTKSNFSQHAKVHSDVKPYGCEHCGKAFARKDHLTIHIRSHTGERPFVCSFCGRGFTQINDMKKHLKIHEKGR